MEITTLRLLGIAIGLVIVLIAFLRLRTHTVQRIDVWFFLAVGLSSISIGFSPELINIPSEILFVSKFPGFRIITIFIILVCLLVLLLFRERAKSYVRDRNFDKLFRSVATQKVLSLSDKYSVDSIMILLPAYNEAENIPHILPKIPKLIHDRPVVPVVIDDGSSDDTCSIAENYQAIVIKHPFNMGGGVALRTGYDVANIISAQVVVTMDADGQHQPDEISQLVLPIIEKNADIVIGSRFLGHRVPDSKIRLLGIHTFNMIIKFLSGKNVTDCTSGFRAFKVETLKKFKLIQDQYHTAELIIEALKRKIDVVEVPITVTKRIAGKSKKGTNIKYGIGFLRSVVKTWFR